MTNGSSRARKNAVAPREVNLRVLGLEDDATAADIKKAYRRLARELHPDLNPDPSAQETFKRVTSAYELLLRNPVKSPRRRRKKGEKAEEAKPEPPAPPAPPKPSPAEVRRKSEEAIAGLAEAAARYRAEGEERATLVYEAAGDVLRTALTKYVSSLRGAHADPDREFLIFPMAKRFVEGSLAVKEDPEAGTVKNLAHGALGLVGLTRITNIVGRRAGAAEKELAARAVMSVLAEALVRAGAIEFRNSQGGSSRFALGAADHAVEDLAEEAIAELKIPADE